MPFEQQVENVAKTAADRQEPQQDAITSEVVNMYSKEGMQADQIKNSTSKSVEGSLPDLQLDDFSKGTDVTKPQAGSNESHTGEIKDSGKKPLEFLENGQKSGASGDIDGSLGGSGSEDGVWNCYEDVFDCKTGEPLSKGPTNQSSGMEKVDQDKEQGEVVKDDSQAQSESNDLKDDQEIQGLEKEAQELNNDHLKSQSAKEEFDTKNNAKDRYKHSEPKSAESEQKPLGNGGGSGPLKNPSVDGEDSSNQACGGGDGGGGEVHKGPRVVTSESSEFPGNPVEMSEPLVHESKNSEASTEDKQEQQEPLDSGSLSDLIKEFETRGIEEKIKRK